MRRCLIASLAWMGLLTISYFQFDGNWADW
jgi:hypothetical protein